MFAMLTKKSETYCPTFLVRALTGFIGLVLVLLLAGIEPAAAQADLQGATGATGDSERIESLEDMPPINMSDENQALIPNQELAALADINADERQLAFQVAEKLTNHPKMHEVRAKVCSASFQIRINRAEYYPKFSMSISAGDRLIDKTTRADEFGGTDSPEYDGNGVNATLALRQQVYDWGVTAASIGMARTARHRAVLERLRVLDEQTAGIIRAALELVSQETALNHLEEQAEVLAQTLDSVEARFKVGAGRLAEMREAQVLKLEQQALIDTALRRRDQALTVLISQYDIDAVQAKELVAQFIANRPQTPELIAPEASLLGRMIELDLRSTRHEHRRLQGERLPKIDGVLIARAWDIDESRQCGGTIYPGHPDYEDARGGSLFNQTGPRQRFTNCHAHEVSGNFEFTMPLYDGGANLARRNEVEARQRGLEARRLVHIRDHESESRYLQAQLNEYLARLESQGEQLTRLREQLTSLQAIQGKSQFDPLTIARLQARIIQLESEIIILTYQAENLRLEGLLRADAVARILGITLEETGC